MAGRQTTIYLSEEQQKRIAKLPREISFSKLIREHFDVILEGYEENEDNVKMAARVKMATR